MPITFRPPDADDPAVFEGGPLGLSPFFFRRLTEHPFGEDNKRELVEDLTRKAKQVEMLIGVLPDRDDEPAQVRTCPLTFCRTCADRDMLAGSADGEACGA